MGPSGTRQSYVFAFAQDGSLRIQSNFGQSGFFVFLHTIFRHLLLSRTGLSYWNTSNKLSLRGVLHQKRLSAGALGFKSFLVQDDEAISQEAPCPPFLKGVKRDCHTLWAHNDNRKAFSDLATKSIISATFTFFNLSH